MKEQANSPLELYEKAYRLQYDENKIPEACRLYKVIIDEFPDSNECGYAVIQLEKLIAGAASERVVVSSRLNTILAVAAVVLSIVCLAGVILLGRYYAKTVDSRLSSLATVSHNLALQEAAKAKAEEESLLRRAAEEKPAADTVVAPRPRAQTEPAREKIEPQPLREARPKVKREPAPAPKAAKQHKAGPPASHQDSVSFF
jgi:hypothetical protein